MALIKFGMMMTDARGKLGGQVFTKTRSGATVRTKVTPTNPQTAAQQTARGILSSLSASWRNLTEEERRGWNSAVDGFVRTNIFGDTYNPSGKNLFVGLNANLQSAGKPTNLEPPVSVELPPYILRSAYLDITVLEVDLPSLDSFPASTFTVVYQATRPFSAGRFNFSGQYSTFHKVSSGTAPTALALFNAYVLKFGLPVEGTKVSFRVFVLSNASGQKSVESVATALVTA